MEERFHEICKEYKWADGYHAAKQNKFQAWLGNGCNYGMMWILLGPGLVLATIATILTFCFCHNLMSEGILGVYIIAFMFIPGAVIEWFCSVERDKTFYNQTILSQRQQCMFRDKNVEYINVST